MIDIEIVVSQHLSLIDILILLHASAIEIESELLSISALNFFHLLIITEGKMIDCMWEVKCSPVHIELLDYVTESMSWEMEISRNFINNNSTFNKAALTSIMRLNQLFVDLFCALTCILEISSLIHLNALLRVNFTYQVMETDIVTILIKSMLIKLSCYIYYVNTSDINDI